MAKPSIRTATLVMLLLAAITGLSMFAVACGDDDDDASTPVATKPATEATESPGETPDATEPATEEFTTLVTKEPGAGSGIILTTYDGYTLYTFDNDVAGSGASACDATCAGAWPPLSVPNPTGSSEVLGELGTITRDDGSPQVTYDGKPLYHYSGDASPGATDGDGVGGVWHVVKVEKR